MLQLLLAVSWSQDIANGLATNADIPSLLRPLFLLLTALFFYYSCCVYRENIYKDLETAFSLQILLCLSFWFFFTILGLLPEVNYFLYLRENKVGIHDSATTFFGTTYFAAYYYFLVYSFFITSFFFYFRWHSLLFAIIALVLIFFASSKTFYPASALVTLLAFSLSRLSVPKKLLLFFGFVISLFLAFFVGGVGNYLIDNSEMMRSLRNVFFSPSESGSLTVRASQVVNALSGSMQNYFFGVGLGRQSHIALESYIASYAYRYGIIGLLLYYVLFFYLAMLSWRSNNRTMCDEYKVLSLFAFVWVLLLPVTLLSSPMNEIGKLAVFSSFVTGLVLFLYRFRRQGVLMNSS